MHDSDEVFGRQLQLTHFHCCLFSIICQGAPLRLSIFSPFLVQFLVI